MTDDIFLNKQIPQKKKGRKIVLAFIILFILLIGTCAAYWYYTTYMVENYKVSFFEYLSQTNIDNVLDTDLYYTVLEKMDKQSYETDTTASFTTTMDNDFFNTVDASKFEFLLKTQYDETNSYFEATINYSSNEILNVSLVSTDESIGIGSSQVYDKYIATRKSEYSESVEKFTGDEPETSIEEIEGTIGKLVDNKIDLDSDYISEKSSEYFAEITNLLPEENFTKTENIVVTINSENINAVAYTLSLDETQYTEVLNTLLNKLSTDTELLEKIVTETESEDDEEIDVETEENTTINSLTDVQVEYSAGEEEEFETSVYVVGEDGDTALDVASEETETTTETEESVQETTAEETIEETVEETTETEETEEEETAETTEEEQTEDTNTAETTDITADVVTEVDADVDIDINFDLFDIGGEKEEEEETSIIKQLIYALALKQKLDMSSDELISSLEEEIKNVSSGITITVYVRNEEDTENETIKVVIDFSEDESVDIEYYSDNEFKITYLNEEDGTGSTIQIERTSTDVKTTFNIIFNEIENNTVVKKTQVDLETKGSKTSSSFTNDLIIKYNNSEGDVKVNIENSINFQDVSITEELTEDNSLFIDDLSGEQTDSLYTEIVFNINSVYQDIMSDLNFIDSNSSNSVIQQPTEDKDTVKQKLINEVAGRMGEAESNR